MDQRISLITLGVQDPAKSAAFYDALGWQRVPSQDGVIAFDLIGQALGLYPIADLARDLGVPVETLGHGAMTLGYNCRSKEDVPAILDAAQVAGATVLQPAHDVFWGGHIGYFRDPDGHIWEVAFNPFSTLSTDGEFCWNGY